MKNSIAELKNLKILYVLMSILIITDYVMPQYFGIHIKFDITCTRLLNILLMVYFILNKKIFNHFVQMVLKCKISVWMALFFMVIVYTGVLRGSINTLFLAPLEILTFYMVIYGIRYVIGIKRFMKWSIRIAYFLAVFGVVEYIAGFSIFHRFLSTVPNAVTEGYRSGFYRIMGPCGHALGYGLFLIILVAISCIDYKKDRINLFQRPVLVLLLAVNIFLTGSRSTLAIMFFEFIAIIIMSDRETRKKSFIYITAILVAFVVFLMAFQGTDLGRYILMQIMMLVDEALGTQYAASFGADLTTLANSSSYREKLPEIFKLSWLNPLLGRGVITGFGVAIDGVYIQSIDNYYVATYIRYGYPGLVSYCLMIIASAVMMISTIIKTKSGICKAVLIGMVCYFVNLWWLDTLQTLKYVYILMALYFAYVLADDRKEKKEVTADGEN